MVDFDFPSSSSYPSLPWMGWLCTYTPEELILAAGYQPLRLWENNPSTKMADAYLHHNLCPYVRSALDYGLRVNDQFFQGMVFINSCDAMRSLYYVWKHYLSSSLFLHFLNLPKSYDPLAVDYFKGELKKLRTALEAYSGRSIKDSDIAEAIRIYNETRDLMVKLYQLRKQVPPFLSGTVVAEVVRASQIMSKIEFNQKLSKFLEEVGKQKNRSSEFKGPRIMVVGSILPNNKLIDIIEQAGAVVVCDDLCTGSRYFEEKVEEGPDLLKAIAQRYLGKAPCARMKATELRLERAKKMAAEFKVEGIIYQSVKFCDNHLYDYPLYRSYFHKMGLPLLQLEDDFKGGNIGQLRTRVEAFIEML